WPRDWSSDVCSSDLSLVRCNHRFNSADMWAKVRQLLHTSRSKPSFQAVSANILNDHFTNISTDNLYSTPDRKATVSPSVNVFSRSEERRVGKESRYG